MSSFQRSIAWAARVVLALVVVAAWGFVATAGADTSNGARFFRRDCARCHGLHGRGDGPDAVIFPEPPRDLRSGFLAKYSDAELVRRVRRGSALDLALDPEALKAREGDVALVAAYIRRLPTIDWAVVEPGHGVYAERCASCHGIYGTPPPPEGAGGRDAKLASHDLSDPALQRDLTDERVRALLTERHAPALQLTAKDAAAVGAYMRILSRGYEVYSRYCINCHGDTGRGDGVAAPGQSQPTVKFDAAYFAAHDTAYVTDRVWHMLQEKKPRMPHLRHEVSETAAHAIVDFLKQLQH